jgi:AhpD family alkylhydroperoxidase
MINGFKLHDPSTAPTDSTETLDRVQKSWGLVPNLHRVLAESPAALEAYATLWSIAEKTTFTPQERNIAYIAILYENECTYCMDGHTNLSRMAKVTRNRGVVSEADVSAFKAAGYDNRAMLDVLVLAATKLISNYTNHLAQTPLDAFMKGAEWSAPGKLKAAA